MKIAASRFKQSNRILYLASMTAEELLATCHTTEWDPNLGWDLDVQGYQRAPVESHYQSIGRFLASNKNVFLPTSALLSAREGDLGNLKFEVKYQIGELEVGELD